MDNQFLRFFFVVRINNSPLSKEKSKDLDRYINMTFFNMEENWYKK